MRKLYFILAALTIQTIASLPGMAQPMAVDLGLSVKWASCNLSNSGFVSSPEVQGGHYAWGEIESKAEFSWSTYKWFFDSNSKLTKYNPWSVLGTVDNRTVLEPEDDAANVILGGTWRIPTDEEWTELRDNCTWIWTTLNGRPGCKITSRKSGYTDKWIFLPATGGVHNTSGYTRRTGSSGYYWSSTLRTVNPNGAWSAWCIYFCCDHKYTNSILFERHYFDRSSGFSVRPVCD